MDAVLGAQKKPHRAKARSIRGFFLPDESAPPIIWQSIATGKALMRA